MSEPWISTGRTKPGPCTHCDATVDYEEYLGAYGSGPRWTVGRHNAPCGLPCMGGGAGSRAYRIGEAHGLPERPCPACTGLAPVSLVSQPAPTGGTGDVWTELLDHHGPDHPLHEAMVARRQLGIDRYGVPLGYGDGRDEVRDALEEALDLAAYLWRLGRRWSTAYTLSDAVLGIAITIDQWRDR